MMILRVAMGKLVDKILLKGNPSFYSLNEPNLVNIIWLVLTSDELLQRCETCVMGGWHIRALLIKFIR